jgi:hypothetical protein
MLAVRVGGGEGAEGAMFGRRNPTHSLCATSPLARRIRFANSLGKLMVSQNPTLRSGPTSDEQAGRFALVEADIDEKAHAHVASRIANAEQAKPATRLHP